MLLDLREDGLRGVPRHTEIPDRLARRICRGLGTPRLGDRETQA